MYGDVLLLLGDGEPIPQPIDLLQMQDVVFGQEVRSPDRQDLSTTNADKSI